MPQSSACSVLGRARRSCTPPSSIPRSCTPPISMSRTVDRPYQSGSTDTAGLTRSSSRRPQRNPAPWPRRCRRRTTRWVRPRPVTRIADLVPQVPLVVDVTQTLGYAPIPRGVVGASPAMPATGVVRPVSGCWPIRTGVRWVSPWPADDREGGRVPGVPNVVGSSAPQPACGQQSRPSRPKRRASPR